MFRPHLVWIGAAVLGILLPFGSTFCDPNSDPPAAVAKEYYLAVCAGDLIKARSLYSTETERFLSTQPPERRAAMESGKTVTFGDKAIGVDIKKQTQQGDEVWVTVTIHYEHHEDANFNTGVVKENSVWKIAIN